MLLGVGVGAAAHAVSHLIGRPVETLVAWESGREKPMYGQLEDLADEYGVSVNGAAPAVATEGAGTAAYAWRR